MSETTPVFVAWEEKIICNEKGSRVIHFYLKDGSGDSVLAVVGTERSVRHMMYVVSDEFLQAHGSKESVSACKWRARREVVEWLTCLVSRNRQQYIDDLSVQMTDSAQAVESLEILTSCISSGKNYLADKMVSRKLKLHSSSIEWSGPTWVCAKQLKHYPSFCRNGTTIYVHSFVYVMGEEGNHYLGYLEDMYEDKKGQKKVKVRWFHRSQEAMCMIPQLNLQPEEVFITPHVQVISAECVNGPATVLTPKHYEKCLAALPSNSSSEIHMCCRQFKNNKLKPFALTKLRGYSSQPILSGLTSPILSKRKAKGHKSHREEDDVDFIQDDSLRPSSKRKRSSKGCQVPEKGCLGMLYASGNRMTKIEPTYPKLKIKLSRKTMGIKVVGPKPQCHLSLKVDDKIELLCQDSGIRGCWFRCKILKTSQRQLKVQYDDVLDVDGQGKLEEWVPAPRVAAPDKLGMRCSGRLTVRPWPPNDSGDHTFEIGAPVDAWWSDGWWEGVITAVDVSGVGTFQIYLPGEEKFLALEKEKIRISRDWVDDGWVDIMAKPDICSNLSSNVNSSIKQSVDSTVLDGSVPHNSATFGINFPPIPEVETIHKDEPELSHLGESEDLKSMKRVTFRKPLHVIDENKVNNSGSGSDADTLNGSEEKLVVEENFDSAKLKLDAEAVAVA